MVSKRLGIFSFVGLALALSVAAPLAQSNVFVETFDRTGQPGTKTVTQIDPATGQAVDIVVPTGAFVNPCTLENVDVRGTSTITSLQTVDRQGNRKVSIGVVTKGTGAGWIGDPLSPTFTGSTYAFRESQTFNFTLPPSGQEFNSTFTDKLSLRGARAVDNWTIRATFKIVVLADGTIKSFIEKMTSTEDMCKG